MKKTVFFQKIIDSRFFAKGEAPEVKKEKMYKEIEKWKNELENKFQGVTLYNKNSGIFTVGMEGKDLESDEGNIQYRINFFITPNDKTTYNKIYEIANSVGNACYFKFL